MKIIRIYNNNVIHAYEDDNEVVAIGRGLAFGCKPGDDIERSQAEKVFELSNTLTSSYIQDLFKDISMETLQFVEEIVSHIEKRLDLKVSSTAFLSLYDHIVMARKRVNENMNLPDMMSNEFSRYYKKEYQVATEVVHMMEEYFEVEFAISEKSFITIHIIDFEMSSGIQFVEEITSMITKISEVVNHFFPNINQESSDYERFITHLRYFSEQVISKQERQDTSQIIGIYEKFQTEFVKQYECVKEIVDMIKRVNHYTVSIDEQFYLLIHTIKIVENTK